MPTPLEEHSYYTVYENPNGDLNYFVIDGLFLTDANPAPEGIPAWFENNYTTLEYLYWIILLLTALTLVGILFKPFIDKITSYPRTLFQK